MVNLRSLQLAPFRKLFAACLACSALLAAGCVSKPTFQVKQAQVTGFNLMGVNLNVIVKVTNRNSFDILVRTIRATTVISDRYTIGPTDASPNAWLPAGQTTEISTPFVVPWPLVLPLLAETTGKDQIPYHITGSANVSATRSLGVSVNNEPLDETGVVPRDVFLSAVRSTYPQAR